jgi:hypothetical protein
MSSPRGDIPKRVKRALREALMAAHEEELRRALLPLAANFDRWRAGEISSGELTELIHKFHNGAACELFKAYNYGSHETAVAYAIVSGILDRSSLPEDLLNHLSNAIAVYEQERRS